MKEIKILILLCLGLLIIGAGIFFLKQFTSSFTFNHATLSVNGNAIHEELDFYTDMDYHTLYRNFESPIFLTAQDALSAQDSYIIVKDVQCGIGTSYYKDKLGRLQSSVSYLPYTEANEYGCSFGNNLGFQKSRTYTIAASYNLYPKYLTEYQGKYYIKFFVYARNVHPLLTKGKNFVISDGLTADVFLPNDDVVVYIPFDVPDPQNYTVYHVKNLDFGKRSLFWPIFYCLSPLILCILSWLFFGIEKKEGDYPNDIFDYPKDREAWEVAAYFNPPFSGVDNNFMPTIILDFYNRKIIDIKTKKKFYGNVVSIKILKEDESLDDIEKGVMDYFKAIMHTTKSDGYFDLDSSGTDFDEEMKLSELYWKIKGSVHEKSREHINYNGKIALNIWLILLGIINMFVAIVGGPAYLLLYLAIILAAIVNSKTSLFVRFKDEYYLEYQQWQGFKNYLSHLHGIKSSKHEGVIIWEKYLVYGTALGVGKKVLDEMKAAGIIDTKTYSNYSVVHTCGYFSSSHFSGSGGSHGFGGGGGGGGFGGGGMGGGGGGGR